MEQSFLHFPAKVQSIIADVNHDLTNPRVFQRFSLRSPFDLRLIQNFKNPRELFVYVLQSISIYHILN